MKMIRLMIRQQKLILSVYVEAVKTASVEAMKTASVEAVKTASVEAVKTASEKIKTNDKF
jgi:hypothetical protein